MLGRALITGAFSGLLALVACGTPPVPVEGGPIAVARLQGQWYGTYESTESQRHGDIAFRLDAGSDTAHGYVVMIPGDEIDRRSGIPEPYPADMESRFRSQGLAISFVHVTAARVFGELEPYRDPECGCQLRTTFTGEMRGDTIEGTYMSQHLQTGHVQRGEWRVVRTPVAGSRTTGSSSSPQRDAPRETDREIRNRLRQPD